MGNSNIKQHIETAQKTGVCHLGKSGLKEFPEEIDKLAKNLRTLDLSENKIQDLPPSLGNFSHLKSLIINSNRLGTLPDELGNLKKLESLSLEKNGLTCIPSSFSKLANLRTVNLSENKLSMFPTSLNGLKNLDAVDLSRNKITAIPESIKDCQAIEVNLNQNQISDIPDSMAECPRLKVIRLEENCLEISAFTPKIMKESTIALFAVEGNVFDMKAFHNIEGYDNYMERFTATKKKFN